MITEARPTSEPVPAVVGIATTGAMPSGLTRCQLSPRSSKSQSGRVLADHERDRLGGIEPAAAAERDHAVMPARAERLDAPRTSRRSGWADVGEHRAGVPGRARDRESAMANRVLGEAGIGD